MPDHEVRDIIDVRERRFHVGFEDDVKNDIMRIATYFWSSRRPVPRASVSSSSPNVLRCPVRTSKRS
jgi:hypothetical protein